MSDRNLHMITHFTVDPHEFRVNIVAAVTFHLAKSYERDSLQSRPNGGEPWLTWKKYSKEFEAGARSVTFSSSALISRRRRCIYRFKSTVTFPWADTSNLRPCFLLRWEF